MTTYTPTANQDSERYAEFTKATSRTSSRRQVGTRAFVLGATIAAVCVGGAWTAVSATHSDHSGANGAAAAPAAVSPATSGVPTSTGTGTAHPATTPTNTYGASVAALQRDLGQLDYYESPVDGINGPATIAAIEDFQRANGLPVDGIAGPSTMAKIKQQLISGDNQMGPRGPPAKPANTTPATPAIGSGATGHSPSITGGASVGTSTSGGAGKAA
jgi:peptidoglycan hydrolase-like protein with peptidoglycan-binding domain